jgi:hypothetical protein
MNQGRPPLWKSPWLWIGLSCGVLALGFGLFLLVPLWLISHHKPGGDRERLRNESTLGFAEMAAREDPNVTVVSRDPKGHTVTLRNQKTGERFVLGLTEEDRLLIRTDAGEAVPDFSPPRGSWSLRLGSAAGPLPSWVPVPPDTKLRPLYAFNAGVVISGGSLLLPSRPVEDVYGFYRGELERKGFKLVPGDLISASSPEFSSSLLVAPAERGDPSRLLLTWSEVAGNP